MRFFAALVGVVTSFWLLFVTFGDARSLVYPLLYPQLLLLGVGVLFTLLLAQEALTLRRKPAGAEEEPAFSEHHGYIRSTIGLLLCIAYVASWNLLGHTLATVLFIAAMLFLGRERNLLLIAGIAIAAAVVLQVFFMRLLVIPLPRAPWF